MIRMLPPEIEIYRGYWTFATGENVLKTLIVQHALHLGLCGFLVALLASGYFMKQHRFLIHVAISSFAAILLALFAYPFFKWVSAKSGYSYVFEYTKYMTLTLLIITSALFSVRLIWSRIGLNYSIVTAGAAALVFVFSYVAMEFTYLKTLDHLSIQAKQYDVDIIQTAEDIEITEYCEQLGLICKTINKPDNGITASDELDRRLVFIDTVDISSGIKAEIYYDKWEDKVRLSHYYIFNQQLIFNHSFWIVMISVIGLLHQFLFKKTRSKHHTFTASNKDQSQG